MPPAGQEQQPEPRPAGVGECGLPGGCRRARTFGAQGIGLCRTEHMFFETERLPIVQRMILSKTSEERTEALNELLPYQRA